MAQSKRLFSDGPGQWKRFIENARVFANSIRIDNKFSVSSRISSSHKAAYQKKRIKTGLFLAISRQTSLLLVLKGITQTPVKPLARKITVEDLHWTATNRWSIIIDYNRWLIVYWLFSNLLFFSQVSMCPTSLLDIRTDISTACRSYSSRHSSLLISHKVVFWKHFHCSKIDQFRYLSTVKAYNFEITSDSLSANCECEVFLNTCDCQTIQLKSNNFLFINRRTDCSHFQFIVWTSYTLDRGLLPSLEFLAAFSSEKYLQKRS